MAISFPTSLDDFSKAWTSEILTAAQMQDAWDLFEALMAKVGINSSAVTSSLDYLLRNASSSNPGHTHTNASLANRTRRIFFGADNGWIAGTGTPDLAMRGSSGNWWEDMPGWAFDAASGEAIMRTIEMPQDWDNGAITFKLHIAHSDAGAGNTVWNVGGAGIAAGGQIDQADQIGADVAVTGVSVADQMITYEGWTGTPTAAVMRLHVSRTAANASDTYAADAWFLGVEIQYTADM